MNGPQNGSQALWDRAAEQGTLGAMLLSAQAIGEILKTVEGKDFYQPAHEVVFQKIADMYASNQPVDAVTVSAALGKDLLRVGGAPYMHTLMSSVPTAANGSWYAEIVSKLAVRRRMTTAGLRIQQMGLDTDLEDLSAILGAAFEELRKVPGAVHTGPEAIGETLAAVLDEMESPGAGNVYHSGIRALDEVYRGASAGRLDVFAGRPAQGKSVLAINFIRANTLRLGIPTILFSLEMSAAENVGRILSAEARVNLHRIVDAAKHPVEDSDWARVAAVSASITAMPLTIIDKPVGLTQIGQYVREGVREGVKLFIVDYLQLMQTSARAESRQVAVSQNIDGLKHLAREMEVAGIVLAQLNRNSAKREDRKPILSDLRESGAIEQTADSVTLIHRPDQEEPESPRAGEADLIVAKQRNGRTGTATCIFQGHYARFVDFAPEPSR